MRIASRAVVCALAATASCGSAFQFSRPAITTSWQSSLASNYHQVSVTKPERRAFNSNHLLRSTTRSTGQPSNGRILHLSPLQATVAPEFASDLSPGVDAINAQNSELCGMLQTMRSRPFFRLYSVDILASCEYMPQELFECYSESCEIYPVDDDEVGYICVYLSLHHLQQRGSLCPHVLFIFQQVDMVRVCNLITNPHPPLPSTLYHTHRSTGTRTVEERRLPRVRL